MWTIAEGLLLFTGILLVGGIALGLVIVPFQLFFEHLRFKRTGKRSSQFSDDN